LWSLNDVGLVDDMFVLGNTLLLSRVTEKDAGLYSCTGVYYSNGSTQLFTAVSELLVGGKNIQLVKLYTSNNCYHK